MAYTLCEKLQNLKPYEPGTGGYRIRLDANESFVELSESTKQGILKRISDDCLNRYPDPLATEACALFADYYGVSPECVTAGNGSDELLSVITQAFLMRGEIMTVLTDDFSMYGFYGFIAEAVVDVYEKRSDCTIDVDGLIEHVNSIGSRMLLFSNPCNPTGLGISGEDALRIVRECPECLVIVDEAYMDFWDQSVIKHINDNDNMIVLKTCSKALRTAGIRCGFAVAGKTITNALRAVKSPYNVNRLTQAAAAEIFSHPEELDEGIKAVIESRELLRNELNEFLSAKPDAFVLDETVSNFFVLHFDGEQAVYVFEKLKEHSILVRCFGKKLRITVGSVEENRQLIEALRAIIL